MATQTYTGTLIVVDCCVCGIDFGMQDGLYHRRKRDHDYFYCPNGHSQHFTAKSEAELRAEAEQRAQRFQQLLADERELHHRTERRLQATRGVVTRNKRRIAQGLCPRCHEHFGNLEKHIAKEHPDYAAEAAQEPAAIA